MSYYGKKIRNKYPLWSKIRNDESSFGSMLIDSIGTYMEEVLLDIDNTRRSLLALREGANILTSVLNIVNLNTESEYLNFVDSNIIRDIVVTNDGIVLEVESDFTKFSRELPSAFIFNGNQLNPISNLILTSLTLEEDFVTGDIVVEAQNGDKVYIELQEEVLFRDLREDESFLRPKIIIRGIDDNDDEVEEIININHKKIYESKYKYKKLCDLQRDSSRGISGGRAIEFLLFETNSTNSVWVKVTRRPHLVKEKQHEFQQLTKIVDDVGFNLIYGDEDNSQSLLSNKACIKLSNKLDSNNNVIENYFEHILYAYKSAYSYQREETIQYKERFTNTLTKKLILDSSEEFDFEIWDFNFDYKRNTIVTIDNNFKLRYYNFEKTPFTKKKFDRTRFVDFEFEGEQYVQYDESSDIFINLSREKNLVKSYFVARQSPSNKLIDDDEFNFEYLQDDGTWSDDFHFFYRKTATKFLEDFLPKRISSGTYTELGQWDYYVFSVTDKVNNRNIFEEFLNGDITEVVFKNELLAASQRPNQTKVYINNYSIIVDSCTPISTYDLRNSFESISNSSNWGTIDNITSVGLNLLGNDGELEFIINGSYLITPIVTYNTVFLDLREGILATRESLSGEVSISFTGENGQTLTISTED